MDGCTMNEEEGLDPAQRRTLYEILENSFRAKSGWDKVEGLFRALGAGFADNGDSRIQVFLNDVVAVFHRPYTQKEIHKGALMSVKRFLIQAGVAKPGE
ncbi:HicA protein [Syntrophobacter fumaroxidans MPOB]|uniref:HicA protein n=2 Tax=Syntrophobacter TaxID=29526 RepID=A0LFD4_SYNFM|nr:HicA protein [Syntrophobacter fumaroxidans MPOB]